MQQRQRNEAGSAQPARVASRCAALLRGGIHPRRMTEMLAADVPSAETRAIRDLVADGMGIGAAVAQQDGPEWRVLGAAWQLAETSGAPLAASLERIAGALHSVQVLSERRKVLLATPRMTVNLIVLLPLAAIGVGVLLGLNPLPVFLTSAGLVLLCTGALMQLSGLLWVRRLIEKVEQEDRVAGLECELMWIALAGGAPPARARVAVADSVTRVRAEWIEYDSLRRGRALDRALSSAVAAGVPAAGLLVEAAREEREATQSRLEQEAERLSVRILLPLAVCILPAFLVLGVVPVVVRLFGDAALF